MTEQICSKDIRHIHGNIVVKLYWILLLSSNQSTFLTTPSLLQKAKVEYLSERGVKHSFYFIFLRNVGEEFQEEEWEYGFDQNIMYDY